MGAVSVGVDATVAARLHDVGARENGAREVRVRRVDAGVHDADDLASSVADRPGRGRMQGRQTPLRDLQGVGGAGGVHAVVDVSSDNTGLGAPARCETAGRQEAVSVTVAEGQVTGAVPDDRDDALVGSSGRCAGGGEGLRPGQRGDQKDYQKGGEGQAHLTTIGRAVPNSYS